MASYYPPHSCTGGPGEELAEEIIQTTSGALSVIGSTYIVADVVRKLMRRDGRTDPYQRIMLGLSFSDIMHSFFDSFMGTWMTPAETGWLMASGNRASCTAQGFFTAFGFFGSYGYQIALSLNILALISWGWSQNKFAQRIEKPMHAIILSVALAYAIAPLPLEGYNADCGQCLWAPLYDESGNLVRGSPRLQEIYWQLFWSYLWIMIIFCTIAMVWVYISVRRQESRMKRYAVRGAEEDHHRESKRIRKILILYTLALFLCWGAPFTVIFASIELDAWPAKVPFGVRALLEALIPLCGFANMLVYFLPNCLKYQQLHPGTWLVVAYFRVLAPPRCKSCGCKSGRHDDDGQVEPQPENINFAKFNATNTTKNSSKATMNEAGVNGDEGKVNVDVAVESG